MITNYNSTTLPDDYNNLTCRPITNTSSLIGINHPDLSAKQRTTLIRLLDIYNKVFPVNALEYITITASLDTPRPYATIELRKENDNRSQRAAFGNISIKIPLHTPAQSLLVIKPTYQLTPYWIPNVDNKDTIEIPFNALKANDWYLLLEYIRPALTCPTITATRYHDAYRVNDRLYDD